MPDSLALREIHLRRTPGFPRGGPTLDGLSPGINIVFGPQQSGKTSTADAIHWLLWPRTALPHASLDGRLDIGGAAWSAELDGGRTRWQRAGGDAAPPPLPPAEQRDRYRLALQDLLQEEGGSFAEAIARESAGGYDLAALAEAVGARSVPMRSGALQKALDAARGKLKEAEAKERAVREDEARLPDLREALAEARQAASRSRLLELAITHARAEEREAEARVKLGEFPQQMARLQADDADRLGRLAAEIAEAEAGVEAARGAVGAAEAAASATGLDEGVSPGAIEALQEELRLLEETAREIDRLRAERGKARGAMDSAARSFAGVLNDERLAVLNLDAVRELEGLSREASEIRQQRFAAESVIRSLGGADQEIDAVHLAEAASSLSEWLRTPDPAAVRDRTRFSRSIAIAALILLGAASVLLGVVFHPAFHLLAACALIFAAFVLARGGGAGDERAAIERRFQELNVPGPTAWATDGVRDRLRELERERAAAEVAAREHRRCGDARQKLELIAQAEEELRQRARGIADQLGLPAELEIESLHWLVERILRWQAAHDGVTAAGEALHAAEAQLSSRIAATAGTLRRFGYDGPDTLSEVRSGLEALKRRAEAWRMARRDQAMAEGEIERLEGQITRARQARSDLRERLAIDVAAEPEVERWCAMLNTYRSADEALTGARAATRIAREALEAHDHFQAALLEMEIGVLNEELESQRARAARLMDLESAITETQTRITDARRRHDVEAALLDVDRAEENLALARDRDVEAMVRQQLIDFLREKTRDERRPEVFHCARRWFARITRGRCELEFDEGEPAAFRATDTATGMGHSLDELSGGTRVQLLLAVRAAFVETQEAGLRLPLLLDETLATADDQRAAAIIEGLVEMARAGRQVFYFTAQADEVAKWTAALQRDSVPHRIVDLSASGSAANPTAPPEWLDVATGAPAVPNAAGHDHDSYGRALGVAPLDAIGQELDSVHLWYFLDDIALLRECLSLGIERLGPLRTYLEHAGADAIPRLDRSRHRLDAVARGLGAFFAGSRIGRGKPVDRPALERSGAVSDKFIDRVAQLADETGGDARLLIERLENGAAERFRTDKLEQLRDYLLDNGYLDLEEPLASEDLHARVVAAMSPELGAGVLAPDDLYRLLRRLRGPHSIPSSGGMEIASNLP